jgi:hypothetical protein
MIPKINTCKFQSFWRSEMSNFHNVNVNCAKYQQFKVPMLTSISFIWSIELSISYVSLKSDNITYVEMSYVLTYFNYFQDIYLSEVLYLVPDLGLQKTWLSNSSCFDNGAQRCLRYFGPFLLQWSSQWCNEAVCQDEKGPALQVNLNRGCL